MAKGGWGDGMKVSIARQYLWTRAPSRDQLKVFTVNDLSYKSTYQIQIPIPIPSHTWSRHKRFRGPGWSQNSELPIAIKRRFPTCSTSSISCTTWTAEDLLCSAAFRFLCQLLETRPRASRSTLSMEGKESWYGTVFFINPWPDSRVGFPY